MAPTFLGEHFALICEDCGFPFTIDANNLPKSSRSVCPNCGFHQEYDPQLQPIPGQQVQIDIQKKPFQRWQVVAVAERDATFGTIKRIVGLPNELVQIVHGNVIIDGQIAKRPLSLMHNMTNHVFDSSFTPRSLMDGSLKLSRLNTQYESTGWTFDRHEKTWTYQPKNGTHSSTFNFLTYQNWRCMSHKGGRTEVFPINDNIGYNQNVSRSLNSTDELVIRLHWKLDPGTTACIEFDRGKTTYRYLIHADENQTELKMLDRESQTELDSSSCKFVGSNTDVMATLTTFDFAQVLQINGQVVHEAEGAYSNLDNHPVALNPVRVGARGGRVQIMRIQIERDFYYLDDSTKDYQLGPNEYFVLGDNSPVSRDSRYAENGVLVKNILGVVTQADVAKKTANITSRQPN